MDEHFSSMIFHHFSSRMEYGNDSRLAGHFVCIVSCILYPFICDYYAPMRDREKTSESRENMSAVWIFKWSKRISKAAATASPTVCTTNAPCIIWAECWITKAAQTESIHNNSSGGSGSSTNSNIYSNRKFSWISEFVEWKLFMLNTNLFKSIVY